MALATMYADPAHWPMYGWKLFVSAASPTANEPPGFGGPASFSLLSPASDRVLASGPPALLAGALCAQPAATKISTSNGVAQRDRVGREPVPFIRIPPAWLDQRVAPPT